MLLAVIINCFVDIFAYKIVVCNHKFIPPLSKQYYRAHVTRAGRVVAACRAIAVAKSKMYTADNRTEPEAVTAKLYRCNKAKHREFSVIHTYVISGA